MITSSDESKPLHPQNISLQLVALIACFTTSGFIIFLKRVPMSELTTIVITVTSTSWAWRRDLSAAAPRVELSSTPNSFEPGYHNGNSHLRQASRMPTKSTRRSLGAVQRQPNAIQRFPARFGQGS